MVEQGGKKHVQKITRKVQTLCLGYSKYFCLDSFFKTKFKNVIIALFFFNKLSRICIYLINQYKLNKVNEFILFM